MTHNPRHAQTPAARRARTPSIGSTILLVVASAIPSPAPAAASGNPFKQPPYGACSYRDIGSGVVEPVTETTELVLNQAGTEMTLRAKDAATATTFDLVAASRVADPALFSANAGGRYASLRRVRASLASASAGEARLPGGTIALPEERAEFGHPANPAEIVRSYAGQYVLKLRPGTSDTFAEARGDLLNGVFCGVGLSDLTRKEHDRIAPLVRYVLWDDLTRDRVLAFDDVLRRRDLISRFLSKEEADRWIDVYCYRVTERAQGDPLLGGVDPVKVWSFAWAPVGKALGHKDYEAFTDLSAYDEGTDLVFTQMGTEPMEGVARNALGFYAKQVARIAKASVHAERPLSWDWTQNGATYTASFVLKPTGPATPAERPASFPGAGRTGLIVLDGTFEANEVTSVAGKYRSHFEGLGFTFGPPHPVGNPKEFAARIISDPLRPLDYMLREGHADGDDDNLLALHRKGLAIVGRGRNPGETVTILYSHPPKKPKLDRISYAELDAWLRQRQPAKAVPLVYLNTSCWGFQKAQASMSHIPATRLVEIASASPASFFAESDATRALLDGVRSGGTYAQVRSLLERSREHRRKFADTYVLPDDPAFPGNVRTVKIDRVLTVRKAGARVPYIPTGYF